MSIHSAAYRRFIRELQHTATTSVDHRVGDALAVLDDDASLALLCDMYTGDPGPSRAFEIAATGLSLRAAEMAR